MTAASKALGFFLCIATYPGFASAGSSSDITASATFSTVYISVKYVDPNTNEEKTEIGSGVLITSTGYVLTATHVVSPWLKDTEDEREVRPIKVKVGGRNAPDIDAAYETSDPQTDIAILRLKSQPVDGYPYAGLCYREVPAVGSFLFAFGYPNDRELTPIGGLFANANGDDSRWTAAIPSSNGMSGGPVYNDRGFVIGLISRGIDPTVSFVSPLRWAKSMIEDRTGVDQACNATCRLPENGVEGYELQSQLVLNSPWLGDGHSPIEVCKDLQISYNSAHKDQQTTVVNTGESRRTDFLGHATYQYHCTLIIQSNPIFALKDNPACN